VEGDEIDQDSWRVKKVAHSWTSSTSPYPIIPDFANTLHSNQHWWKRSTFRSSARLTSFQKR